MANRDENAMWSIFGYLLSGLIFWGGSRVRAGQVVGQGDIHPDRHARGNQWGHLPGLAPLSAANSPASHAQSHSFQTHFDFS